MLQKPFDRSLWSDPWNARNVVGFVSGKGEKIDNLIRRNTELRDDAGHVVSEIITNKHTQYWKLNQLLVACPTVTIEDGTDIDIDKKDAFDAFMSKFKDANLGIRLEEDTYVKDGETKKTLRVKRFVKATTATVYDKEEVPF